MTNDAELIARLRDAPADGLGTENLCLEAADRIEALIAEQSNLVVAAHRQGYDQARAVSSELRRAMAERIMELEAKLATCEKYRDAYAECDRIGAQAVRDLEAKLAKAVEALQWCAMYGDGDVALATLAEIKGESHE